MTGLKCSEEEAREVYLADKAIDQGERMDFDLSKEDEKAAKKYLRTGTRKTPTNYKFDKKQKKENPTRSGLVEELAGFLNTGSKFEITDVQVTNKEKEILFRTDGKWYTITLMYKRNMNNAEK